MNEQNLKNSLNAYNLLNTDIHTQHINGTKRGAKICHNVILAARKLGCDHIMLVCHRDKREFKVTRAKRERKKREARP